MSSPEIKCIAYYLGQYHPTVENNEFWGQGFTEWHNVASARPLYPGHQQPKLPGRLGFYDLRCSDTLEEQIKYAREIGIDAFCFWHYWFAGRRVLYRPLDAMISLNHPDFRFMLGWANESWSGVWHGVTSKVLIEQSYNSNEIVKHARLVADYINTGKYVVYNDRYPFVVYKPKLIPSAVNYWREFRRLVRQHTGSDLYLIGNWVPGRSGEIVHPEEYGLDSVVVTPVAASFRHPSVQRVYSSIWVMLRKLGLGPEVRPYSDVMCTLRRAVDSIQGTAHSTIVTGWDNTPRSGRRGLVLTGYGRNTLASAARHALELERKNRHPLLFVKSWNEWAEGNMLEPRFKEAWNAGEVIKNVLRDK